ncbi:PQQ-binding-like beta-propeller repeat protein [Streptomyces sp. NBC_01485]|uniref:PQQ-binding-like beta-propeller repeat protein n=1 Tax=Streptomyces sp. NBC_01485 TaxID=2903884 RepID=UPI002E2F3B80|nr:PQQ-binding-like beta-propeller repeat protein [Streptomyces sp. NBC_01485]
MFCAPAVADGFVYGAGEGGDLYAVDAATGKEAWTGVVYVGSENGELFAVTA